MNTLTRRLALPVAAALTVPLLTAAPAHAAPVINNQYGTVTSHVVGTFGKAGTVTGTFTPRAFKVNDAGRLVAVGQLATKLTRESGAVVGTDTQRVRIPVRRINGQNVSARAGACDVLNLNLGPLDLDVLGLEVHLKRVVLDIVAQSGAGKLLGNLLCAVAGLLDGPGLLDSVSRILNSILAILRL